MRNQSMSTQEFNNRFEEAVQIVDGPHPERAVQLLEDLMLEAFEFYLADDQIVIQLRMYLGRALERQQKKSLNNIKYIRNVIIHHACTGFGEGYLVESVE